MSMLLLTVEEIMDLEDVDYDEALELYEEQCCSVDAYHEFSD
jgi:hypothetical protein